MALRWPSIRARVPRWAAVSGPQGVATDSAGNVYIAYSNGTVYRTPNSGGRRGTRVASGLTAPHQLAVDGAGNLYVADSGQTKSLNFRGPAPASSAITGTAIRQRSYQPQGRSRRRIRQPVHCRDRQRVFCNRSTTECRRCWAAASQPPWPWLWIPTATCMWPTPG